MGLAVGRGVGVVVRMGVGVAVGFGVGVAVGIGVLVGRGLGVAVGVELRSSIFHNWEHLPLSVHCCTLAPFAVDAAFTSNALLLWLAKSL